MRGGGRISWIESNRCPYKNPREATVTKKGRPWSFKFLFSVANKDQPSEKDHLRVLEIQVATWPLIPSFMHFSVIDQNQTSISTSSVKTSGVLVTLITLSLHLVRSILSSPTLKLDTISRLGNWWMSWAPAPALALPTTARMEALCPAWFHFFFKFL